MKFELKVVFKGRKYKRVKRKDPIQSGAIHTLDGQIFSPLVHPESVGQTPNDFSRKRAFYNPV